MSNNFSYAVEAHDLVKVFPRGNVRALDGVSLHVEEGTILGLLGPNGAGKTTAVRILSTILSPDSGSGCILGHDVVKEADTVRRIIGLAGQYAAVDENLTGRENIRMVGRLSHMSWKASGVRATELLEDFGLSDAGDRVLKTYSGGMRRRLDLAAALVARPPVLFLDEPTTGLDPVSRAAVWEMVRKIKAQHELTVLLTTHYMDEADNWCDRIAIVDHGHLMALDSPIRLKASIPGTNTIEASFGDAPTDWHTQLEALPGVERVTGDASVARIATDNGPETTTALMSSAAHAGVRVLSLAVQSTTLDDVFVHYTGRQLRDALQEPSAADKSVMINRGR
jgi:ABC-2 type transport system ATP-binding protein